MVAHTYKGSVLSFSKHLESIFPSVARTVTIDVPCQEKRLELEDGDFLDYDFYDNKSDSVVIISHGLEGNSKRAYVMGMVKAFCNVDIDVVAWNYRSCGRDMNRNFRFYHAGDTPDLEAIVKSTSQGYKSVYLVGFSLGGNLTLKFLGEPKSKKYNITKAVVFSVPFHVKSAAHNLNAPKNFIYQKRFLMYLSEKVAKKALQYPQILSMGNMSSITSMYQFDECFTAPLHGFKNAYDYYDQAGSIHYLSSITCDTTIINAKNDTLLTPECLDTKTVNQYPSLHLYTAPYGGHCGFASFEPDGLYWSEKLAAYICKNKINIKEEHNNLSIKNAKNKLFFK